MVAHWPQNARYVSSSPALGTVFITPMPVPFVFTKLEKIVTLHFLKCVTAVRGVRVGGLGGDGGGGTSLNWRAQEET